MKHVQKIKPFHIDERGEMSYLLPEDTKIVSSLFITSKKGSVRANHYHKKDTHYCYVLKGKIEYSYINLNAKTKKKRSIIVNTGEVICTTPMILHAMKYLEDTEFLVLTTEKRDQKKYEKDTVRVKLV
jgi:quercetin dioxygenase-like cupin family protein